MIQAVPSQRQQLLNELDFMDIYVHLNGNTCPHYRAGPSGNTIPDADLPESFFDDANILTDYLRDTFKGVEMALNYSGMRLRATRLETANGEIWACMRRLPDAPKQLEQLGLMRQLPQLLEDMGRRSGLILICGSTGQGKTTTAASLLTRFMETYGGIAFTLEDPVEYDMAGRWGTSGYCYQAEVKAEQEWGSLLKRALRWHPRYISVGEVRTPDAANQLLRAATSGHTVIATMHAGSMEEGLEGLLQLAEHDLHARAATLLAAGLIGVLHQSFGPTGLYTQFMFTEADNPGSPIRALIRDKRIGQTRTLSDQQMAKLTQTGRIF